MEAPNEAAIRIHLRQQNIIPTKVNTKGKEIQFSFLTKKKVRNGQSPSLPASWQR